MDLVSRPTTWPLSPARSKVASPVFALVTDLSFLTIGELGALLRSRQVSARDLAGHFLERLELLGPRYNAVVTVLREPALAEWDGGSGPTN